MHSLGRRGQAVKVWLYADAGTSSAYKYNLLSFLALAWARVCVVGLGAVYWPALTYPFTLQRIRHSTGCVRLAAEA